MKLEVCILTLTYSEKHFVINIQDKVGKSTIRKDTAGGLPAAKTERNTYCLEGSKEGVGDDLSAGGGGEETDGLVLSSLGAESLLVDILEDFVETELSEALGRVADEGCVPSDGESLKSLSSVDSLESVRDALVQGGISL